MSGAEDLDLPPDVHDGAEEVHVIDGRAERLALAKPESNAQVERLHGEPPPGVFAEPRLARGWVYVDPAR